MRNLFNRAFAIVFAAAALAANAGGPIGVCTAGVVTKYPGNGSVTLNYDRGNLGSRTNAAAAAIVNNSIALWNNVTTATITLARGTDLPVDVTAANFSTYLGNSTFGDGINPVVYDTDGSITDAMLGTGAHTNVLGFAGSAYSMSPCQYVEGRAVINGAIAVSDATMTTVLAHELGHFIGLDHTQLDGMQGLATSNYPLMYPIAQRTVAGLHEDDIAAVSALYPDTTVNTTYGTLTGTFTTAAGTPILGANIWARNTTTGQLFSVVSDYLMQGNGAFRLLLPPGTYTLNAEAVDRGFTGGSGVGPYSDDLTGASFQSPLYSGTTPMANVAMASQVAVTAGCSASVTFRINGTSTAGATCGAAPITPSTIVSPANGSMLPGSSATFTWNAGSGAITERYLVVSTTPAGSEIYAGYQGSSTSRTVTGIPTDGHPVYVRLLSYANGAWQPQQNYTYTAALILAAPVKSNITSPATGSTLTGTSATFTWDAGTSVTARYLSVGSTLGGSEYYGADQGSAFSRTVTGLPSNGSTVYVRLASTVSSGTQVSDYTYTAYTLVAMSTMTSPANGSTLNASSVTFNWTAGTAITANYMNVGTTLGGSDIYGGYVSGLSRTITGIPQDGRAVYVRLMSYSASTGWLNADYTYAGGTAPTPVPSAMTSPAPGSVLSSSSVTFNWSAGTAITANYLMVGTTLGGSEVYGGYPTGVSRTVTGIPQDGRTVYVRLMSYTPTGWVNANYTYTGGTAAAPTPASPSDMTAPTPGSTLSGASATFTWTAGSGSTATYLMVGTTLGGSNYYAAYESALSRTVTGLPQDGRTIYVRLMSYINGGWLSHDYTYVAASTAAPAPAPASASAMTSPAAGSALPSPATFTWSAGSGSTATYLMVGTTMGGAEIYSGYQGTLSQTVANIPQDGRSVYVRLMSYINGNWQGTDYAYATVTGGGAPVPSAVTSPAAGSALGTSATFAWNAGSGVTARYLMVGTTLGGTQYYQAYENGMSRTVTGLPGNGSTVYVRLMSYISGNWQIQDYTYR